MSNGNQNTPTSVFQPQGVQNEATTSSTMEQAQNALTNSDSESFFNSISQSEILASNNYDASSLLYKLQERGVNPLRPELLAIIEFLPLAINDKTDGNNSYYSLDFSSDSIQSNVTTTAKFAEVQRLLNDTTQRSVISLVEKESGMKIELMKEIIEYFILVLNKIGQNQIYLLETIFRPNQEIDDAAANLIIGSVNDNFFEVIPNEISQKESTIINNTTFFRNDRLSIDNKLNFLEDEQEVNLRMFLEANQENPRIIILARCAILQLIAAGAVRYLKRNTSYVDDFIRAVFLGEVVNPELTMSSESIYSDFIHNQSYDLSDNPLSKIGIEIVSSQSSIDTESGDVTTTTDDHSMDMSNNYTFLNVIGGLVCEMLFFNNKDESLANNSISINDSFYRNSIAVGRSPAFANVVSNVQKITHNQILNEANTLGGIPTDLASIVDIDAVTNSIIENKDELVSFCIFNEVVGDNVFIKGKDIVSNFKSKIQYSNNSDFKDKLLSQYIHQIFLKFNNTGTGYPDFISRIESIGGVLNFDDITTQSNSFGHFTNTYLSYRNEKNGITGQLTLNKYMPLETSRGIYDFDIGNNANLIPVEDAFFNNTINNPDFDNTNPENQLSEASNFSQNYLTDIRKFSEDIIRLFGLGYDLNEGTISEIAENSKNSKVAVEGITPVNYLNYYFEGIAKDLEGFIKDLQHYEFINLGDLDPNEGTGSRANKTRASILSLAMILNAESEDDFLNLFRGFYFCDRTVSNHLKLPTVGVSQTLDPLYTRIKKQYRQNATAGTDYSFEKLFNSLTHSGNMQQSIIDFSYGEGTWISYIYNTEKDNNGHDIYSNSTSMMETGKVFGYDEHSDVQTENLTNEYEYISSRQNNQPYEYIRPALANGFSPGSDGEVSFSHTNQKACIQLGGSFYQRLINTPILYTKIRTHVGTADGECSNAINPGSLSRSDYENERFDKTGYYKEGQAGLEEFDASSGFDSFNIGGISRLTHIQKCYVMFTWYVKFLQNTIGIKMKTSTEAQAMGIWQKQKLAAVISSNQILGVIYALKGILRENIAQEFAENAFFNNMNLEKVLESYDNAMEQLSGVRSAIKRKKQHMLTKINVLVQNALDIKKETADIIELIKSPPGASGYDGVVKKYFENYSQNFTISRDAIGNATKYYYDHLAYSSKSFPYSNYDKRDIKEYKKMYQTLSQKGFNLLENEKRGRKNILNVGIPAGLVDTLAQQAYTKSGDDGYLDSTLIAIYLHRTNELTEEEEVFPRPFVFDTAKYISNINADSANNFLIPELLKLNELEPGNFADGPRNIGSLTNTTRFLLSDRNRPNSDKINFIDNGSGRESMRKSLIDGIVTKDGTYNAAFLKDVCTNHLFDHSLKTYQKLLLNLEFENYNFLLSRDNVHLGELDTSNAVLACKTSFKNFILNYYPSFNVDTLTRSKVSKMLSGYDSLFFNNSEEKIKQIVGGFIFDRVFSIPYSDRDFIIKTDDYQEIYGAKIPIIRASSQQLVEDVLNFNNINKPVETNYSLKINNNQAGTIYKFFATVSVLKRW